MGCDYRSNFEENLKRHILRVHKNDTIEKVVVYPCADMESSEIKPDPEVDDEQINGNENMELEEDLQNDEKIWQCDKCQNSYGTKYEFKLHKYESHIVKRGK